MVIIQFLIKSLMYSICMYIMTIYIVATTSSEKEHTLIPNAARDIDENSIISLSTIVNTLQDVNSGTPRRLVDQLLMAQKKKKNFLMHDNTKETCTLPSDEKSISAMPIRNSNKFDDRNVENLSSKLSLDSKTKSEIDIKQEHIRVSFPSNKQVKEMESFTNVSKKKILKEEPCNENIVSSFNQDLSM